jgi:hypothetical protein
MEARCLRSLEPEPEGCRRAVAALNGQRGFVSALATRTWRGSKLRAAPVGSASNNSINHVSQSPWPSGSGSSRRITRRVPRSAGEEKNNSGERRRVGERERVAGGGFRRAKEGSGNNFLIGSQFGLFGGAGFIPIQCAWLALYTVTLPLSTPNLGLDYGCVTVLVALLSGFVKGYILILCIGTKENSRNLSYPGFSLRCLVLCQISLVSGTVCVQ